ncbi:MAG: hypothetical protein AAF623_16965, partial [Planctomycetota bacterium]
QKICLPTARLLARPPARDFETQPILLADVFPDVPEFEIEDRQRLQIELIAARQRLGELPVELAEKQRYIAKLRRVLDRARVRVQEMHNRVVAIRKRFGVVPAKPKVDGKDIIED